MFTEKSPIVQSYLLLIRSEEKSIEDVPEFSNLRKVVLDALQKSV